MSDSETTTLLQGTRPAAAGPGAGLELDYDDAADHPVQLEEFAANVRSCHAWLAGTLPLTALTGVVHLYYLLTSRQPVDHGPGLQYGTTVYLCQAASHALLSIVCTLFFATILRPAVDARTLRPQHATLHRTFVTVAFWSFAFSLLLHFVPGVAYTLRTHRAAPADAHRLSGLAHVAACLAGLAAAGLMRRGPRLRCSPLRLGTGYGIQAEGADAATKLPADDNAAAAADGDEPNVIDYRNCSIFALCTLAYSAKIVIESSRKGTLTHADMPLLESAARNAGLAALAQLETGGHHTVTTLGIIKTLWVPLRSTVLLCLSLETVAMLLGYIQVWALHEVVDAMGKGEDERPYAYLMCWGLFVGQAAYVLISAYSWVTENYLLHSPVRFALSGMLFAKILRCSDVKTMDTHNSADTSKRGRAQVMNLITADIGTVASLATLIWNFSNNLLGLVIGLYLFWSMLGPSSVIAIAIVPLNFPYTLFISRLVYRCDKAWYRARDARTSAIKEFLSGVKVVKLNAFEPYERERIERLREAEYRQQRWRYWLGTFWNISSDQLPTVAIVATFWYHTKVRGQTLDPATAFVAFSIFGRIRSGLESLPGTLQAILTSKVALDRIKGFLNSPEVAPLPENPAGVVECKDAIVAWPTGDDDDDEATFRLRDITVSLPKGQLTLVSGPLGSGKSLFLHALLGEAVVERGSVLAPRTAPDATPVDADAIDTVWSTALWLNGTVAYAPQHAYVRHGTLRDNIVFGLPFWAERYNQTLRACSLLSDIELLVDGDMTEIGENGVNLSGGQKARVNLARCVYSRASTIYADDILSAVDAFTAQHLVDECLSGPLIKDRTVVLVTHHVELCLPAAKYYIGLDCGRISQACPAREARVADLTAIISPVPSPTVEATIEELADAEARQQRASGAEPGKRAKAHDEARGARVLYQAEHQAVGRVATSHYLLLIKLAGGVLYVAPLVVLVAVLQASDVGNSLIIERWSSDTSGDPSHVDRYIRLYVTVSAVSYVAGAVRWVWLYGIGNFGWYNRGTRQLHRLLVDRLMAAPLGWFERTPKSRIMNVLGQDMWKLDSQSADAFGRTIFQGSRVLAAALVVVSHEPILGAVLVGLGVPLVFLSRFLGRLRTDLRRLNATADSPLIGIYHDAIDGAVIVRAFGLRKVMASAMMVLINRSRAVGVSDWMSYNLVRTLVTSSSALSVSLTGFLLVWKNAAPARTGLILTFALMFSNELFSLLEQVLALEVLFVSAERANHYIQMDQAEPFGGAAPPADWPTGRVEFSHLSIRYADDLPDVLHDVSFTVEPGMRVGIVGATGSGKSTLALSLFRGIEAHAGRIEIDGIDAAGVALPELRARLNMVAQDGTLSSGTLRDALDMTRTKDDYEIYTALKRVYLLPDVVDDKVIETNPFANLDTFVAVEGANFSHGQRQLLCLARALLKQSRVLVMDEATSAVDFETDAKITAAVRESFKGTTMLVIAHRLATIVNYDRVLVLEHGRVREYGPPAELMVDQTSAFYSLCAAQGPAAYDKLLALSRTG